MMVILVENTSMLLVLESIMLRLSTTSTLDAVQGSVRLTATTVLPERRSSTHVLMKGTVGSTALICVKSDMQTTMASIRPRLGHGTLVDLVGSQPPIAFSKRWDSLPKAKNNLHPHHGLIQGRQSRLTRARTAVAIRLLRQIPRLQVSLRFKLDHWPRLNSHLLQSRTNRDTMPLRTAATSLHPTQWDLLLLVALVLSAAGIVLMSNGCLLATTAT